MFTLLSSSKSTAFPNTDVNNGKRTGLLMPCEVNSIDLAVGDEEVYVILSTRSQREICSHQLWRPFSVDLCRGFVSLWASVRSRSRISVYTDKGGWACLKLDYKTSLIATRTLCVYNSAEHLQWSANIFYHVCPLDTLYTCCVLF